MLLFIELVWPSDWIRTLFFNPTRLDEQSSKPSPRVRTSELVQGSGSNKTWYWSQLVEQNCLFSPARRAKLTVQFTIWEFNSRFLYESKFELSARRTYMSVRFNSSNKNSNSINSLDQKCLFDSTRWTRIRIRSTLSNRWDVFDPAQT
jgi:hypothetical protein